MANPDQPSRVLGGIDATSIVVGAIIGVGIFFTPSRVAALVGSGSLSLIAWAIAGFIALCGALTFAELGGLYHGSGAQYAILRDAYGPLTAFLYVFCNATAIQAGAIGIIGVICAQNLAVATGAGEPSAAMLMSLATALVIGLVIANLLGARAGARIQNVTVLAKLITLLAVTALAVLAAPPVPAEPAIGASGSSPVTGVLAALVPALFAYGGWQHALWISGEVRDPKRLLPRAIVGGVLIVVVVYLLASWAYLRLLGVERVAASRALAADAVAAVWPGAGRRAVALAVAISAFGVLNAQLLSGPRLIYGMARDGRFFAIFGALRGRNATPAAAVLLLGGMSIALLLLAGPGGIDRLLNGVVFIDGVFFALTGAALLLLRRKRPDADWPASMPGYPVVPILFVLGEVGVVAGAYLSKEVRGAALIGVLWIAAGAVLYAVRFRREAG